MMSAGNGFVGHKLDCHSSLAAMTYDSSCTRCGAIKKVVHLRRKTADHGASAGEEESALTLAESLVRRYNLTRGECYDRLYLPPTRNEYKASPVRRRRNNLREKEA